MFSYVLVHLCDHPNENQFKHLQVYVTKQI